MGRQWPPCSASFLPHVKPSPRSMMRALLLWAALLHSSTATAVEGQGLVQGLRSAPEPQHVQHAHAAVQRGHVPETVTPGAEMGRSLPQGTTRGSARKLTAPPRFVTFEENERAWADEFGQLVKGVAAKPSSCVPDNTVVSTMSNSIDWPMMELQTKRIASEACFFIRFIIITLDEGARAACEANPAFQCAHYVRSFGHAEYLKGDYVQVVFMKLKALRAMLLQGITAYFYDADLVFFRVPDFPPPDTFDIILQVDAYSMPCEFKHIPKSANPSGLVPQCIRNSFLNMSTNTGQMGFSSNFKGGVRFLEQVLECGMSMTVRRGNQWCFKTVLKNSPGVRLVHLPSRYADHRWAGHWLEDPNIAFVTYHAVLGAAGRGAHNKRSVLLRAVARENGRSQKGGNQP